MGRYHCPVCGETVIGPFHHCSVEMWGRQQQHGVLLYKLKDLGITGKLGIWFFQFLTNRSHYVTIPGGISKDSPVLSGVP